ncbi:hypothetical protein ACLI09_17850 [Flavobacterium sp. RHBU_24]|uniref:hypothetical protein n=1 Tax=Flavobacterium sp. RHBU_24 TaxID=3391185 RepID=UPI003985427B
MFTIPQLKQYSQVLTDTVPAIKKWEIAVTVEELSQIVKDHKKTDNMLLLSLVPHHDVEGDQHDAQYRNVCGFFLLEKTDYKEGQEKYLEIFERTQQAAADLVARMREDKDSGGGIFCNFLSGLDESSISIDPIKMQDGCNGHYVAVNFKTRP